MKILAAVSVSFKFLWPFKLKYWKFPYLGSGKVSLQKYLASLTRQNYFASLNGQNILQVLAGKAILQVLVSKTILQILLGKNILVGSVQK